MATSHVLFSAAHHPTASSLTFETNLGLGQLVARRSPDLRISLGFPSDEGILVRVDPTEERYQAAVKAVVEATGLGAEAILDVAFSSRGCLVEIPHEVDLKQLKVVAKPLVCSFLARNRFPRANSYPKKAPIANFVVLSQLAPFGSPYDIYSRVFTPAVGADEDPVVRPRKKRPPPIPSRFFLTPFFLQCGSAHCFIGPRWLGTAARARIEKASFRDPGTLEIKAKQVSQRGGEIDVRWDPVEGRITLTGEAVSISTGQFLV